MGIRVMILIMIILILILTVIKLITIFIKTTKVIIVGYPTLHHHYNYHDDHRKI